MAHPLLCWDIISEGMARRQEFAGDITAMEQLAYKNGWAVQPLLFDNRIVWENKTIIITDTTFNILLATKNIYQMNGYRPGEVIGRNPKMFRGTATTAASKQTIRTAVKNKLAFECDIINYRKDGKSYNCHIEGYPVLNEQGHLVNFIALENIAC